MNTALLAQAVGAVAVPVGVGAATSWPYGLIVAGVELVAWGTLAEIADETPLEASESVEGVV